MPAHNSYFLGPQPGGGQAPHSGVLEIAGPVLQVEVHVPAALAVVMTNTKQLVPPPVVGWALIDTGATKTAVHEKAIVSLGVQPIGTANGGTAAGQVTHNVYPVRLKFPGTSRTGQDLEAEASQAIGVDLSGQVLDNKPIIALVGRDLLAQCVLVYNGSGGHFTLTW